MGRGDLGPWTEEKPGPKWIPFSLKLQVELQGWCTLQQSLRVVCSPLLRWQSLQTWDRWRETRVNLDTQQEQHVDRSCTHLTALCPRTARMKVSARKKRRRRRS